MRGSITKRGNSWTALVDLPPDPVTGTRRRKRITARTKREVETQVAELIHKAETGFTAAGKLTVREFFDRWLESAAPTLRPSTARRYRDVARLHIVGVIGNVRLAKLTPGDVQRLYANRLAAGLSPTSVHHIHAILHRALDQAVRWGLLMRNVTDTVDPPRRSSPEMRAWDARQVAAVLAAALVTNWRRCGGWRSSAGCGGERCSDCAGRTWISIVASSRCAERSVGERPVALKPVSRRRRRGGVASPFPPRSSTVCVGIASGSWNSVSPPARPTSIRTSSSPRRVVASIHPNSLSLRFGRLIERAGVPDIRFHDLRHTNATVDLATGTHPKVVQERLGHASISETLDRYSHLTPEHAA